AMPGVAEWMREKGDAIARNFRGQAADAAPSRPVRRDVPSGGWLLHAILDFLLPALLFVVFLIVRNKASNEKAWNWEYIGTSIQTAQENPLFSFYHDTLGWGVDSSVTWTHLTFRALVFGVPLLICFMYSPRPLRFGLGIGVLLLG